MALCSSWNVLNGENEMNYYATHGWKGFNQPK